MLLDCRLPDRILEAAFRFHDTFITRSAIYEDLGQITQPEADQRRADQLFSLSK